MGQKVNPNGFRIGINKDWNSTWVAGKKDIGTYLKEDTDVRRHIMSNYCSSTNNCSISKILIERTPTRCTVNVYTGRPGMLIGQKGAGVEKLKKELQQIVKNKTVELNVREVKNIDSDATLVAQSIATQLEKRIAWRRAMKMAIQRAMRSGIKGIKVMVGGRLDGADIARSEHYQQGILPLHTIRSDIEYGFAEAKTTFGIIGVKCWICYGEIKGKTRRSGDVARATVKSDRPREDRKFGDRKPRPYNAGYRPFNNNGERGDRPQGDRPFGDRPRGPRPDGARPPMGARPNTGAPRPMGGNPRPTTPRPTTGGAK
ncbi:MAG: 30S ribosomal protein S3 [Firmicutes bacterium]|nr:30S ribosomal protein S3 [Bacillota bacterium]